jgi:hypothetical protein
MMTLSYNRQDYDGHKFNVPEHELEHFDMRLQSVGETTFLSAEYYEAVAMFNDEFEQYMVG